MSGASNGGTSVAQAKREALQRKWEDEAPDRERAARERACFWTWPLGHVYELEHRYVSLKSTFKCVGCGRRIRAWAHEEPGRLA